MIDIDEYQNFLSDTKATVRLLKEDEQTTLELISKTTTDSAVISEAQEIMSVLGIVLQEDIKKVFEELVTQSLQAIFGEEYSFELESRISRGKPEIELFIEPVAVMQLAKNVKKIRTEIEVYSEEKVGVEKLHTKLVSKVRTTYSELVEEMPLQRMV